MAKRKLVIFETTHHETLPALLDLSELYFENTVVFLPEATYVLICSGQLPEAVWPKTVFIRQGAGESNRGFISKTISFIKENGCTHLHISTLDSNFLFFTWKLLPLKRLQISLSVQAVNEYCVYKFRDLRDLTESMAKIILHRRIMHYRVFAPLIVTFMQQRLPRSKVVFLAPRFFVPPPLREAATGPFRIVVPGSVDPNRRDYYYVHDFLVRYLPVLSGDREIRLVILGKSDTEYGREVIARLLSLESARFRLSYYPGVVPQAEYEAQLSAADLLWSPIRVSTVGIRKTAETYGLSTSTGLTGDILLNCTPVLVPEGFAVPEYFEAAMPTYRSPEDLAAQIAAFINDPAYVRDNRKRILHDLSFFVKGNFQKPFEELMDLDEANG